MNFFLNFQISLVWTTFLHLMDSLLIKYDMMIFNPDFFRIFPDFFPDIFGFSSNLQISSWNWRFTLLIWYDDFVFRKIIRLPDFFPDSYVFFNKSSDFFIESMFYFLNIIWWFCFLENYPVTRFFSGFFRFFSDLF